MPPRITQESHRPRVSDRTMVDTCKTAQACLVSRFEWRCRNRNRSATEMEKQNQRSWFRTHQRQASRLAPRGWKSRNVSPLSVEGELFSLTFPFYRTGNTAQNPRLRHFSWLFVATPTPPI